MNFIVLFISLLKSSFVLLNLPLVKHLITKLFELEPSGVASQCPSVSTDPSIDVYIFALKGETFPSFPMNKISSFRTFVLFVNERFDPILV